MRKDAREIVFKLVFGFLFTGERDTLLREELKLSYDYNLTKLDLVFIDEEYEGVVSHVDELKEIVGAFSKGFSVERIYKADLAVLLLATYEIKYCKDLPFAVTVNEALNLSKRFGTEKSSSFINGILASVIKETPPREEKKGLKGEQTEIDLDGEEQISNSDQSKENE